MNRRLFEHHPVIGYRFIPGLRARVPHEGGGYLVRANQAGFRSEREFVREKRPGVARVLLFGDSYTAGDGVGNGQRYSDLLERRLGDVEIYNYGLPGTGTDQQFLAYRELAAGVQHDVLVIAVLVENVRRNAARYREFASETGEPHYVPKPYFTRHPDGRLELRGVPVPTGFIDPSQLPQAERPHLDRGGELQTLRKIVGALGPAVKERVQRIMKQNPVPAYDDPDDPDWLLTKAILAEWAARSAVPVVIMPLPLYHFVEEIADPSAYQARFAELGTVPHVTIHDPLPALQTVPKDERRAFRFAHDIHPTPKAHAIIAESLAGALEPLIGATRQA